MELDVTIKEGKITFDVIGGKGPACKKVTEGYEQLASGPVQRTLKPEHDLNDGQTEKASW